MRTLTAIFLVSAVAHAATVSVPDDFPTLEAAMAAANSGDVILIEPGAPAVTEGLTFTKPLTFRGAPAGTTLAINAPQRDVTFFVDHTNVTFDQLTTTAIVAYTFRFLTNESSSLRITNCQIHNGSVFATGGTISVVNTTIDQYPNGPAVGAASGGAVQIFSSLLMGNLMGIERGPGGTVILANSIVAGNNRDSMGNPQDLFEDVPAPGDLTSFTSYGNNFLGNRVAGGTWLASDVFNLLPAAPFALSADSPYRDHGGEPCIDDVGAPLLRDQAGNPRSDGRCDAGPLEYQPPPAALAPLTCDLSSLTSQLGQMQAQLQRLTAQLLGDPMAPPGQAPPITTNVTQLLTSVTNLTGSVASLQTTSQSSESGLLTACSANASATQLSALQDQEQKFEDRDIEERLAKDQPVILSLALPAPWGQIDRVRTVATQAIVNAQGAGLAGDKAATLLQQAEGLYAAHSYKAAYKAYANAYQAAN